MTKPIKLPFNDLGASDEEMLEFYKQHPTTFANSYGDYYASVDECVKKTFDDYAIDFEELSISDVRVTPINGVTETANILSIRTTPAGWIKVSDITENVRSVWESMGCSFVGRSKYYSTNVDVSWDVHTEYPDGLWRSYAGAKYGNHEQPEHIFVLPPLKTS